MLIKVGTFGSTHGIKGDIKIHFSDDFLSSSHTPISCEIELTTGQKKKIEILSLRPNASHYIAHIKGFETPESVVIFRGAGLFLPRQSLPPLSVEEIYLKDLIGLTAVNKIGSVSLGYQVTNVIDNPAHPILQFSPIAVDALPKEILVPFLHLYVGDWDLSLAQIEVRSWELWFEV